MRGLPDWGIFTTSGRPAFAADTTVGVELQHEYQISDAPQEEGAFQSYNKVAVPYRGRVTYAVAGSAEHRGAFIASVERAIASLDFYTVVMPEFQWLSANVTRFDIRRTERRGVTMILVDVWCQEVRVVAKGKLTSTKSVNGQQSESQGQATAGPPAPEGTDQGGSTLVPGTWKTPPTTVDLQQSYEFQTPMTVNPDGTAVRTVGSRFEASAVLRDLPTGYSVNYYDGTVLHQLTTVPDAPELSPPT